MCKERTFAQPKYLHLRYNQCTFPSFAEYLSYLDRHKFVVQCIAIVQYTIVVAVIVIGDIAKFSLRKCYKTIVKNTTYHIHVVKLTTEER